jgi:hypothetical protein
MVMALALRPENSTDSFAMVRWYCLVSAPPRAVLTLKIKKKEHPESKKPIKRHTSPLSVYNLAGRIFFSERVIMRLELSSLLTLQAANAASITNIFKSFFLQIHSNFRKAFKREIKRIKISAHPV